MIYLYIAQFCDCLFVSNDLIPTLCVAQNVEVLTHCFGQPINVAQPDIQGSCMYIFCLDWFRFNRKAANIVGLCLIILGIQLQF